MDVTISLANLFWICSGIGAIIAVYKLAKQPFNKLDDHERRITNVEKALTDRKNTDTLMLKSLNAITNHMIDGSSIDKLKEARDELQKGIIEHQK